MEILTEEATFQTLLDFNIDNDALTIDNFDLEKFINGDMCMPDDVIPAIAYSHPQATSNGFRINNIHLQGVGIQTQDHQQPSISQGQFQGAPKTNLYCPQQQLQRQHQNVNNQTYMDTFPMIHKTILENYQTLPDSPPDSEPYSPPDGHLNGHTSGTNCINIDSHSNSHQNTQQDNTKYTSSQSTIMHSHMYPAHHRLPGMSQPKMLATLTGYHDPPLLNHHTPINHDQLPLPPVSNPLSIPQQGSGTTMTQQILSPGNLSLQNKKRKQMDSSNEVMSGATFNRNGVVPHVKQEPNTYTNSSFVPDCDDDYSNYDRDSINGYDNGVYQVIKWQSFQANKWATLTNSNLKDLPAPQYRVDADKGFNFSVSDDSFVCQKKNHFQITCHVQITGDPKYVRTHEGVKKIDHYCLHFYGVKLESQNQTIKIEQSQSDRSKKPFKPVRIDVIPDQVFKLSVGRLHFSETTSNNMRKKGRPNPDQRYFMLVVALHAHSGENDYMVAASVSEKIIVRASNPGQFDSDIEVSHFQKGSMPDSVYHIGPVGVNTDHPDEALTVHGNIKLSGQILHTSDIRAKQDLKEVNSKAQLKKVSEIKIYDYQYSEDYADFVGLPENKRKDTGVIAQEIQELLPDAVIETGDIKFENGTEIKNLLVVNKDRIFMENVGAVKELCKLTDNLEVRIDELEKMNSKLAKLKRFDSLKSSVSSKSTCSNGTVNSSVAPKTHHYQRPKCSHPPPASPPPQTNGWCSNRFIQITIIALICIMAFCLIAITVLYIMERQKDSNSNSPTVINNHYLGIPTLNGTQQSAPSSTNSTGSSSTFSPSAQSSNSQSSSATRPLSSQLPVTSSPSVAASTAGLWLATIPTPCGPPACPEICCNIASDEGLDTTGYQSFLADMASIKRKFRKKLANSTYTIINSSATLRSTTERIEVIINPNGAYDSNHGGPYRVYRLKRNINDNVAFQAQISIPELNFTVTDAYKDENFSIDNNYTYNLAYSKYFNKDMYTVRFSTQNNNEVYMCHHGVARSCDNTMTEQNWTDTASEWKIPIGLFQSSFFRFRVTTKGASTVCQQHPQFGLSGIFTEYNLFFTRLCT